MSYPTYYRLDNRCLKRDSDTSAFEVRLPGMSQKLPLCHSHVEFPSKERLDEEVTSMNQVDSKIYEDFLSTFFSSARDNEEDYQRVKKERMKKAWGQQEVKVLEPNNTPNEY